MRKKLCVGVNGHFDEIVHLTNAFDSIRSIYTNDYIKKTAGGRNVTYLDSIEKITKIADHLKSRNIDYYVTNNHTVFVEQKNNDDFWGKYKTHILELQDAGITGIITGHPFFVEFIKKNSSLKVCVSTTAEISTVRAAKYYEDIGADLICPSYSINYDMEKLYSIKNCLKHATIKLLVNEMCIGDCVYRKYHQNACFSNFDLDKDYGFICHKEMISSGEKMLQNNTIRPEDIHHYFDISDNIKISLRQPPFYDPEKNYFVVKAYTEEKYDGNFIDLISQKLAELLYIPNTELTELYDKKIKCDKNCYKCNICRNLYKGITGSRQNETILV